LTYSSNILQQSNGTAAQRSRIFNTGNTTNGEWFDIDWQTTANVATIGARNSGTGALRPVTAVGNWTFSAILNTGNILLSSASNLSINARFNAYSTADGLLTLSNWGYTGFNRLNFGGESSGFPSLKRSSAILQARLADDSGFTGIQGQLRIHQNAATETITPTHTMTMFDASGTAYKVPCVAA
jgi:hypothetical protein